MCGGGQVVHRDLHGVEVGECACVEGDEWDIETYMVQRRVSVHVCG